MAFDTEAFIVTVAGVVVAAYALNYFGYLKHSSPLTMFGGGRAGTGAARSVAQYSGAPFGFVSHPSISPGALGATEFREATSSRPL